MEISNSTINPKPQNDLNLIDTSIALKFKNEDYILKLNTMQMLKFFKDELSIKYIGKGYNSIDFAVNKNKIKYLQNLIKIKNINF
jgi:hypothetical protein